jgi:hypothetical protein
MKIRARAIIADFLLLTSGYSFSLLVAHARNLFMHIFLCKYINLIAVNV